MSLRTLLCLLASLVALTLCPAITIAEPAPQKQAPPTTVQDVFEAANTAAFQGKFGEAISGYAELVDAGIHDADVYFNLATVLAQAGDYPLAILYYERALSLRPGDADAAANLAAAEEALENARVEAEGEAMIHRSREVGEAAFQRFSKDTLAYILLFANLLFFVGLTLFWFSRRRPRWLMSMVASSAVLLAVSALGLAIKAGSFRQGSRAVVLEDRVVLREGPDPRARIRGEARGGDRGEILASADGEFVKLQVTGGPVGWAKADQVGTVDPAPADNSTH